MYSVFLLTDLKPKNILLEIIAGLAMVIMAYFIIVDEIAINAGLIAQKYGYLINLTEYETLSVKTEYLKILSGFIVVYGQLGGIVENFLSTHISDVLALGFNRGDAARFLFASTFPFIASAIFIGLMSRNFKEYTVSTIITAIISPILGYGINPTDLTYLYNTLEFSIIGFVIGFIPGALFSIFGGRIFEKGEETEPEVKEVEVDIDVPEVPKPDEEDLDIDLDEEIELDE